MSMDISIPVYEYYDLIHIRDDLIEELTWWVNEGRFMPDCPEKEAHINQCMELIARAGKC